MKRLFLSDSLRWRRWALLGLALWLAGCSVLTLAYNRASTLLYWRLDAWLDLTSEQATLARTGLDQWHEWHRRAHLPRYAEELRRWQALLPRDIAPADVCASFERVRGWAQEAGDAAMPLAVRLAPTLTTAQIDHWARRLAEGDEEFRRDFFPTPQGGVAPKRLERVIERTEMVYGRLTPEQRQWWRERLQRSAFSPEQALADRQKRQADWLATARKIVQGAPAKESIEAAWQRSWQAEGAAVQAERARVWADGCSQLAEWHNRTTPEQRRLAVQKLQTYERDLLVLVGNGAGS